MDDLASKLGELLNNPESMERIKNLASMLGGSAAAAASANPAPPAAIPAAPEPPAEEAHAPAMPSVDNESLQMIMKIAPLLSRVRQEDDSTRLLHALRPFLGEEKRKKLDEAIKLMQFLRMVPYIRNMGLF